MKSKVLFRQVAVALGLSVAMTSGAGAAFVNSWDYTQEFEFVETIAPGSVNKEGATTGVSDVDGFTKLSWGTESNEFDEISSLVINPEDEVRPGSITPSNSLTQGNVLTSTDLNTMIFADGPVIVHNNFVITGDSLTSANARDFVTLTPVPDDGLGDETQNILFDIAFEETTNSLGAGTFDADTGVFTAGACPAYTAGTGGGLGITQAHNSFGCGDIFALSGGLLGIPTVVNTNEIAFLIDSFTRAGFQYSVFLREQTGNLEVLSDAACSATLGAGNSGCIGWVTNENEVTPARLEFAVLEVPVPEPATLLLLSGGLLGLGAVLRRKNRSAAV